MAGREIENRRDCRSKEVVVFRIGEFSKLAQVSAHLLRHYDELGLLRPAKIDESNGYRYYSAAQLAPLNRILALRDMGLALDQIRPLIDGDTSAGEIRSMFALKKAELEESIRLDTVRIRSIEARLQRIDDRSLHGGLSHRDSAPSDSAHRGGSRHGGWPDHEHPVVVKSVPAQSLLGLRQTFPDFAAAQYLMGRLFSELKGGPTGADLGHLVAILHNECLEEADHDLELGFVCEAGVVEPMEVEGMLLQQRVLDAVPQMATMVLIGPPDTAHIGRGDMARWMERNGYQIAGTGREVFLVPPRPGHEDETVLEIQYPISRADT